MNLAADVTGLNVLEPDFVKGLIGYAPAPYWYDNTMSEKANLLHAAGITLRLWNFRITKNLGPRIVGATTKRREGMWGRVDIDQAATLFDMIETEFELALHGQKFKASTVIVSVALKSTPNDLREASLLLDLVCLLIDSTNRQMSQSSEHDLNDGQRDTFFARANAAVFGGWCDG